MPWNRQGTWGMSCKFMQSWLKRIEADFLYICMPITPYDSIFISSSVSPSLQFPAYHFTQAHMGDHTFHLHKPNKTNQLFLRIHRQLFIQSCSKHSSGVARWQTMVTPLSLLAKEFSKKSKRCNWFKHCPPKLCQACRNLACRLAHTSVKLYPPQLQGSTSVN